MSDVDELEEDDDEHEPLERASFFAPNEPDDPGFIVHLDEDDYAFTFAADRRACVDVWRLYLRSSADHGHIDRAEANERTRSAHIVETNRRKHRNRHALSHREMNESNEIAEEEMPYTNGLKDRLKEVHPKLTSELGRTPTLDELVDATGLEPSVTGVKKSLEKQGLAFEQGGPKRVSARARAPVASKPRPATSMVHIETETPPSVGTGALLAIMALQKERTMLEAELAAIDGVIERLRK